MQIRSVNLSVWRKPARAALFVLLALGLFSMRVCGQTASKAAPANSQNVLRCNVTDGFTLAAVGDMIVARPISGIQDEGFLATSQILRDADVAFGNMEGTLVDIRHFKGYPGAENGGGPLIDVPEVAQDLRAMGIRLVSRANNHTTDWGLEGMRETDKALDEAGIVHAGTGENRDLARAPHFLDTPKGRVGIVSMASTFTPMSVSTMPLGEAPGRPGLNALRTTEWELVTPEMLENLRKIFDAEPQAFREFNAPIKPLKPNELQLFGVSYRSAPSVGFSYDMNPLDLSEILASIRQGKEDSDFMIATTHTHEPDNWSDTPPDFLVTLAHDAIDAGADEFIGHGPHQLRGIEIYKGKPIFYSLGNYFFELDQQTPAGRDQYEAFEMDPSKVTDYELNQIDLKKYFNSEIWYQSVIAVSKYEHGEVSEIRLYPVELGFTMRGADRGVPRIASPAAAQAILARLQKLSQPFHTEIQIDHDVGIIRLAQ
ncbi:MAG TPA: CapA family protein [Candidatus Acidoferrales bacterium]|nr:CapA family protein [Candidatus Acidoferrales bacterium]